MNKHSLSAEARRKTILSIVLGVICVIYVLPVLTVVINSFKLNTYVIISLRAYRIGFRTCHFSVHKIS